MPRATTKKLNNAKNERNDEFYTPRYLALHFIERHEEYLKDKKIVCPCDSEESHIYKVLKEKGYNVTNFTYFNQNDLFSQFNMDDYDICITNPPFSKLKKFIKDFNYKPCILIVNFLAAFYRFFQDKNFNFGVYQRITDWENVNKPVPIFYANNVGLEYEENNKIPVLDKSINVVTDKITGKKFVNSFNEWGGEEDIAIPTSNLLIELRDYRLGERLDPLVKGKTFFTRFFMIKKKGAEKK